MDFDTISHPQLLMPPVKAHGAPNPSDVRIMSNRTSGADEWDWPLERSAVYETAEMDKPVSENYLADSNGMSHVSSHYWQVPDKRLYLTAMATHETDPLLAISSGSNDANLFIYELGRHYGDPAKSVLTHHQTVTLGGIHSLEWASPRSALGSQGNVVLTGHNSGMVHMILLSDPYRSNDPAEILRRFNHNRHVDNITGSRIRHLNLAPNDWSCCVSSSIMTLFSEHLFLWDPSRSDRPLMRRRARGVLCLDMSPLRDGIICTGGVRGVSIKDIREKGSSGLSPPDGNDTTVRHVKWSPLNDNLVATAHDDHTVKVWDIRSNGPVSSFSGHSDTINSIHWSPLSDSQLYSSSHDGTIRAWDLNSANDYEHPMPSRVPSKPANQREVDWLPNKSWRLYYQRTSRCNESVDFGYFVDTSQRSTSTATIFSNEKQFLALNTLNDPHSRHGVDLLSIDSDGSFGMHILEGPRSNGSNGSLAECPESPYTSDESSSDISSPK